MYGKLNGSFLCWDWYVNLPWMTGFLVDIQLEILIVDQKAATRLIDGKVRIIHLGQKSQIVTIR